MMGYLTLSCILGGSLLSSASVGFDPVHGEGSGGISWDVGIVIISLVGLTVSLGCDYLVFEPKLVAGLVFRLPLTQHVRLTFPSLCLS